MNKQPHLIDPVYDFLDGHLDGAPLVIKTETEIPTSFVDTLRQEKAAKAGRPMGEFHRFASIPVAVVEQWKREGFDIHNEKASAIVARLSAKGFDDFITTPKKV